MPDSNPPIASPQTRLPSRSEALWFEFRANCFRGRRFLRDLFDRDHRRHRPVSAPQDAPVVAEARSGLWPEADAPERALVLGKIQNLRIARLAFDRVTLRRGETLSFWAQVGRPSRRRGFAVGRELREGCLIPTVGGGLCQLSNALYEAALRAGMEVVERHAHSQTVPGSAAERGRDATVFWNYVDLRLRAPYDLRLDVALDTEALYVRVRSDDPQAARARTSEGLRAILRDTQVATRPLGDCATCGRAECFRNTPDVREEIGEIAVLSDAPLPEHAAFLSGLAPNAEFSATPTLRLRLRGLIAALGHRWRHSPPAQRAMTRAALAAEAAASRLRPKQLDIYVDQDWLPFLWRRGVLAGRRFHVLMRALPMANIHETLEIAAARHPHESTLRDFRADAALLRDERAALDAATSLIGPHALAMRGLAAPARQLPWRLPATPPQVPVARARGPLRVLFPASSLVRKGVLELAAAAQGLPLELILPTQDGGEPTRWGDLSLRRIADREQALALCDAVALPAWVEHQPRALLAAIACGKPVIATAACGLGELPGWIEVPAGDVEALRVELRRLCAALDGAAGAMIATGKAATIARTDTPPAPST